MAGIPMRWMPPEYDGPDVPGEYFIHPVTPRGHIIHYICPRGRHCGVPLQPAEPNAAGCSWTWDGNLDRPTLTPSINCNGKAPDGTPTGCGWHGLITAGVMVGA